MRPPNECHRRVEGDGAPFFAAATATYRRHAKGGATRDRVRFPNRESYTEVNEFCSSSARAIFSALVPHVGLPRLDEKMRRSAGTDDKA